MRRALFALVAVVAIATFARLAPADDDRDDDDDGGRPDQLQLVDATIPQLQRALQTHLITHEQLVQMYQARIAAYDKAGPKLNSILFLNPNAAADGRARERHPGRRGNDNDRGDGDGRGRERSPMFGIPILLKDNIDTKDMPTTAGSIALAGSPPPQDAFLTKRLGGAAAIIIGKATLTEFANFIAIGMPSGYSSLGG